MNSGGIPENGVLGKQIDKISDLVGTIADGTVSGDERVHFFLGLEGGEPVIGLHALANEALVEAGHAHAAGLVGQGGDADNGDKNQKQQKGEDDLLPQRPPPCGVALQFAERRADMCARRERNRVDARLTHRLPPNEFLPSTAIVEALAHET